MIKTVTEYKQNKGISVLSVTTDVRTAVCFYLKDAKESRGIFLFQKKLKKETTILTPQEFRYIGT